jgi:hypothetical protein
VDDAENGAVGGDGAKVEEAEDGVRGVVDETAEGVADEDNEAEDEVIIIGEWS